MNFGMMGKGMILAAVLAFGVGRAEAQSDELRALAEEYNALPEVQQMIDDMFSAEAMAGQFLASLPPGVSVSEAQAGEIGTLLSGVLTDMRPKIEMALVDASVEHFSADELKALIAFYQTELGGSVMAKMQPMMQTYSAVVMPEIMQRTQSLGPQIMEIMQRQ